MSAPDLDTIREYHLDRLNQALRRPGMWGGELTIRLFMDTVAFVQGMHESWKADQDELRHRGALTATGVTGAFAAILPGYRHDGAVASVYAEIAWRHRWLTVDRYLSDEDYRRLRASSDRWRDRDHRQDQIEAELGPPSVLFGGRNPRYAKTLAYVARDADLICLHFASTYDWNNPGPEPESPVLVAVRHGTATFADSFVFSPAATAYRRSKT